MAERISFTFPQSNFTNSRPVISTYRDMRNLQKGRKNEEEFNPSKQLGRKTVHM